MAARFTETQREMEMKARARNTDPQPSYAATKRMSQHITKQASQVLELVGKRPQTASQLEERAARYGKQINRYTISRRLPDLESAGKVKRMGNARCPIRGVLMTLWVLA